MLSFGYRGNQVTKTTDFELRECGNLNLIRLSISHNKRDVDIIGLLFRRHSFWVVAMETRYLLHTGPNLFDYNTLFQKVYSFLHVVFFLILPVLAPIFSNKALFVNGHSSS